MPPEPHAREGTGEPARADGRQAEAGGVAAIELGGRCSRVAFDWARRTFRSRSGRDGDALDVAGASYATILRFGSTRLGVTSDGIGTKVELAERTGVYDTLGHDLVAMVVDDLAANGIEPTSLSNILDVDRLDERIVGELLRGLAEAAASCDVVVTGGEIAELGGRVHGYGDGMHFNWCATAIGVLRPGLEPIDGSAVSPGDAIVAVRGRGFRSNGLTLARKVLGRLGERWHEARLDEKRTWGQALLTPSLICSPLVVALLSSGIVPRGIAHVTGGGIPDKLGRVLRTRGVGAHLVSLFDPPDSMRALQAMGDIPDETAYRVWNMGNAMLLVLEQGQTAAAIDLATSRGFEARRAGIVTDEPAIRVESDSMRPRVLSFAVRPE